MIFSNLIIDKNDPIYIQIEKHIKQGIKNGELKKAVNFPLHEK